MSGGAMTRIPPILMTAFAVAAVMIGAHVNADDSPDTTPPTGVIDNPPQPPPQPPQACPPCEAPPVCATCPVCVETPVCHCEPCAQPPSDGDVGDIAFALLGVLLGGLISFYATIVFERYKRFRETLMQVAYARQHNTGYATSLNGLQASYDAAVDYWRQLEQLQWTLNADGHFDSAAEVGKLVSFAYRAATCVEKLLHGRVKGITPDQYLQAYQSEYGRISNREFTAFENRLKPRWKAILQWYPHPYAPVAAKSILVDYFDTIL